MTNDKRPMTDLHRIAHVSDIHFGKITHPQIVELLVEEINAFAPTVVVVSGDLTQRARDHERVVVEPLLQAWGRPVPPRGPAR